MEPEPPIVSCFVCGYPALLQLTAEQQLTGVGRPAGKYICQFYPGCDMGRRESFQAFMNQDPTKLVDPQEAETLKRFQEAIRERENGNFSDPTFPI